MAQYVLHTLNPDDEEECSIQICRRRLERYGVKFTWLSMLFCVDCAKKMLQFDKEKAKKWLVEIEKMQKRLEELT